MNDLTGKPCPHCNVGKLKSFPLNSKDYICIGGCGRGWIIGEDGSYHAIQSAGWEVYDKKGELISYGVESDSIHIKVIEARNRDRNDDTEEKPRSGQQKLRAE